MKTTRPQLYILWALPKGATERMHEQPLTSFPLTYEQVQMVKASAHKDGWHSFRAVADDNRAPDFAATLNIK